jgi:radical SAM protein with 4Fe4S-binding SPASM domain
MVAAARLALPRANIDIVTNGDYLKPESLTRLRTAGLSVLRISVYLKDGERWSLARAREEMERLGRRIGIVPAFHADTVDTVGASFAFDGLEIAAWSHDFDRIGYDRGESVAALFDKSYVRQAPCTLVFTNFTVDFDGKVMPCCNLRGDHPEHRGHLLGDLSKGESIFDVYASPGFAGWRKSLAGVGEKASPCRSCKQKAAEGAELERLRISLDRKLRSIGAV